MSLSLLDRVAASRKAHSIHVQALADLVMHLPGLHDQKSHGRRGNPAKKIVKKAVKQPAKKATKVPRPRKQPKRLSAMDIAASVQSGIAVDEKMRLGDNGETSRIQTNDGSLLVRKKFGPVKGHTVKDQIDAEDLALRLGRAVGAPVPNAHIDRDNDTIYMELMAGRTSYGTEKDRIEAARNSDAGKRLGILDLMIENNDRHRGNWLIDSNGDPVGIDHSFGFRSPVQREGLRYDSEGFVKPVFGSFTEDFSKQWWAEEKVPPDRWGLERTQSVWATHFPVSEMRRMRREIELTRPHFEEAGRLDWYDDALAVFDGLTRQAERKEGL